MQGYGSKTDLGGIRVVHVIVRPSVGLGKGIEDRSWRICVAYVLVRPSVGLGLSVEGRSCGDVCCLQNCQALGGSRVTDRRQILMRFVMFT